MGLRLPPIVLFDDGLGRFGPLTDLRASFELRTGVVSLVESLVGDTPELVGALWVRPEHQALVASRHSKPVNQLPDGPEEFLLVNGRLAGLGLSRGDSKRPDFDGTGLTERGATIEARSGHVIAARLERRAAIAFLDSGALPKDFRRTELDGMRLFARPWEILEPDALARRIARDIATRCGRYGAVSKLKGVTCIGKKSAFAHKSASILPGVIMDAKAGPVAIAAGAVIRPGAVIVGPAFIGEGSIVAERSLIKSRTVIGPYCRAAGEIGNVIFQGYANKSHDGHLGDSFIGEWVNLGAGTTNSNLLNTYGEVAVRLEADAPLERTGSKFVGAIVGDHVKTAILTRLPTGCVIGTGSMIATTAFAPTFVPRFSWLTDPDRAPNVFEASGVVAKPSPIRSYRFEKFIEVARTVWQRRGVEPTEAMIDALRRVHERATSDRAARPEPAR